MGNRELSEQMSARRRQAWGYLKTVIFVWVRTKGGSFKDWFQSTSNRQFRLFYRYIKSLRCSLGSFDNERFLYGERQLSFDETPAFRFNLFRGRKRESDAFDYYYTQSFLQRREDTLVEEEEEKEKGVDAKAEEFITKFQEQMRLQRQISLMQYNERLFIVD